MIGKAGLHWLVPLIFKSWVMIWPSRTQKESRWPLTRKLATVCSWRSTKSVPSPNPSEPTTWPSRTAGAPWFPTDLARLRIALLPIWLSDFALVKSKLVPPAAPRDWPSITRCWGLRRNWEAMPSMSAITSANPSKLFAISLLRMRILKNLISNQTLILLASKFLSGFKKFVTKVNYYENNLSVCSKNFCLKG